MYKILIIIPYFGLWPFWFDFFLHSCRFNSSINWLLIGDNPLSQEPPPNVEFRQTSYENYISFVSSSLDVQFKPTRPYKLCDLKPMYGFLHQAELVNYDFWGFCDLDVVLGNLRHFLSDELLKNDVISCHATRLSGHFSLFRNTAILREAFRKVANWQHILCDQENHQLDEKEFSRLFIRYKNYPAWIRTYLPGYNQLGVKCAFIERYSTPNCRILWEDGSRNFPDEWYWNSGTLTNNSSDRTFMYFHFLYWKQNFWKKNYRDEGGHLISGNANFFNLTTDCNFFRMTQDGFHEE